MSEIFISWSKDRSRRLAGALLKLIQTQIGEHVVWSPDLPKGSTWFGKLAGHLEGARAGIICITPENRDSPWLLFEAGALIRCDYEVALFPVLLDVSPNTLEGPLSLVQSTTLERDPVSIQREVGDLLTRVVNHVNQYGHAIPSPTLPPLDEPIPPNSPWKEFSTAVLTIEPPSVSLLVPGFGTLFRRKTFQEPFVECADQRWLERYAAARWVHSEMTSRMPEIDAALPPGARTAYDRLSSAVNGYAMAIAGLLLEEQKYRRNVDGLLEDPKGELMICERRRREIQSAFLRLDDPTPPVFDESRTYEELSSLEERKRRLIHPLERKLETTLSDEASVLDPLDRWQRERARTSPWLYDRIVFYLRSAYDPRPEAFDTLNAGLEFEISRLESLTEPDTLVGVYYALEAADKRSKQGWSGSLSSDLLDRIDSAIEMWNTRAAQVLKPLETPQSDRWDANFKIRRIVERLRGFALKAPRPTRSKKKKQGKPPKKRLIRAADKK